MTVSVRGVNLGKTDSFVLLIMTVSVSRVNLVRTDSFGCVVYHDC